MVKGSANSVAIEEIENTLNKRIRMIVAEGVVFVLLLILGIVKIRRSILHEIALNKQQSNFLLSITHELKSPLTSIKLHLQTILKRELPEEEFKKLTNNSLQDIDRLNELVENMLLATRIENNSYSFPKQEFNFSELIKSIVEKTNSNRIQINASIEENINYNGDEFALTSVIINLIDNSIKYSKDNSSINISLKKENGSIHFSVKDNGVGIPDDEQQNIFNKFYRIGPEEKRRTKGTGLGLYIVKQVLDKHDATICVKDNTPTGSIFEITF